MTVKEKTPRILTIEISEAGAVELKTLLSNIAYLKGPLLDLHAGLNSENVGDLFFDDLFDVKLDGLEYVNR